MLVVLALGLLGFGVGDVCSAPTIPNNFNLAAQGVNGFLASPDGDPTTGVDPGLMAGQIFAVPNTTWSWNGQFAIPGKFSFRPSPHCSLSASSEKITSTFGFSEKMSAYVKTESHFLWWHHSTEHSFSEVSSATGSLSYVLLHSRAECTSYTIGAPVPAALTPADMNPEFLSDVVGLITPNYDPASLGAFVARYGTSYQVATTMGAAASAMWWFSQENFTRLEEEHTDMPMGASIAFLAHFGDSALAQDKNFNLYQKFSQALAGANFSHNGPLPPSDPNAHINSSLWAKEVLLPSGNPVPISYTLGNISSLLTTAIFPKLNASDLAARAANLVKFINTPSDYCPALHKQTPSFKCANVTRASRWDQSAVPSLPTARGMGATATDGRFVYVLGGTFSGGGAGDAVSDGMLVFDTTSDSATWQLYPPPFYTGDAEESGGLFGLAAAGNDSEEGGTLWVSGGWDNASTPQNGIVTYDSKQNYWSRWGSLLQSRGHHCMVAVGDVVVVAGGVEEFGSTTAPIPSTEVLHAGSGPHVPVQGEDMITPRIQMGCAAMNGLVWAVGGTDGSGAVSSVIETFDPTTLKWQGTTFSLQLPRTAHSVVTMGSRLFTIGGSTTADLNSPTSDCRVLYVTHDQNAGWHFISPLGNPTLGSAAVVVSKPNTARQGPSNAATRILLMGGLDGPLGADGVDASQSVRAFDVFDVDGTLFYQPPPSPTTSFSFLRASRAYHNKYSNIRTTTHSQAPSLPSASQLPIFPFVSFLSHGYDFLAGVPGMGQSGWVPAMTIDVACDSCFSEGKTLNGAWRVPDGVTVHQLTDASCSFDASAITARTAAQLQGALGIVANLNAFAGIPFLLGEAFSAGADAQVSANAGIEVSGAVVATAAKCSVAEISLDAYDYNPKLSSAFLAGVEDLIAGFLGPNKVDALLAFISRFGLAYPTSITLGGTLSQTNLLAEANFHTLLSMSADISESAKKSFAFFFGSSSSAGGSFAFKEWLTFSAQVAVNITECSPYCYSGTNGSANTSAWQASISGREVPISYTLAPIWDLFAGSSKSLAAAAWRSGDNVRAARVAAAGEALKEFVASGGYCNALPGCLNVSNSAAPPPRPYWGVPGLESNRKLPAPRVFAAGATLEVSSSSRGTLVVAGGSTDGSTPVADTFVLSLDEPERGWMRGTPMPVATLHAPSVSFSGGLVVLGGVNGSSSTSAVWRYELSPTGGKWSSLPSMLASLTAHAVVATSSRVYVFGGVDASTAAPTAAVSYFDGKMWHKCSPAPLGPFSSASAAPFSDNEIYILGGSTPAFPTTSSVLHMYYTETDTWNTISRAPYATLSPFLFTLPNGQLLVTAGDAAKPGDSPSPSNQTLIYNPNTTSWTQWPDATWPLTGAVAVFLPRGLLDSTPSDPLSSLNQTNPRIWLVGGQNATVSVFGTIAQLRIQG